MLKIALIGTRGIPSNYGGFETCVEEVGKRLVRKGNEIFVYSRSGYGKKQLMYLGMKNIYTPSLNFKIFETLSHTITSTIHAIIFGKYDIFMFFNSANSPVLIFPKVFGKICAINTDGLEWKRSKWNKFGKKYYKFAEWLTSKLANYIITDSKGMHDYYLSEYGVESYEIAYGADIISSINSGLLKKYKIEPYKYFLQITRFEPENNPLLTIQAFKRLNNKKGMKLVLVGDVKYPSSYSKEIWRNLYEDIIITGFIYEKNILRELRTNAFVYIHGNEVGGTNPALLEAMGAGCIVISRNVNFNRDVLNDNGIFYEKSVISLKYAMEKSLVLEKEDLFDIKNKNQQRIKDIYNWDLIADKYEQFFLNISR